VERLVPDRGPTTVSDQLDLYRPWEDPPAGRPHVALNFAATLDGRASIDGHSGPIGSATDTSMLAGLRTRFDAVMIGAGTMRAERYGRVVPEQGKRERRERVGLSHDPLMVIVSGRLDLPWDAPLFIERGRVLIFTSSEAEPPRPSHRCGWSGTRTGSTWRWRFGSFATSAGSAHSYAREGRTCTPSFSPPAWSTSSS
jgi:hypothetical protein